MSYDNECYRLACIFLTNEGITATGEFDKLADKLAQEIQDTIENFLQSDVPQENKARINDG